jgi:peptidoglycan hydrolase-like protein with peptidoglycan-binding domain
MLRRNLVTFAITLLTLSPLSAAASTSVATSSTSTLIALQSMAAELESELAALIAAKGSNTTPAASSSRSLIAFTRVLSLGSTGTDVSALQQILKAAGFFTYPTITGYFGSLTEKALAAYQTAHGLDPIGYTGPKTRGLLNNLAVAAGSTIAAPSSTPSNASSPASPSTATTSSSPIAPALFPIAAGYGGGGASSPTPDTTPPTISGTPSNMSVAATSASGATVTFTAPTATDPVGGTDPVSCAPASGSTFALGVTTVTCTATDRAGDASHASFTVTVQETTAPSVSISSPSNGATVSGSSVALTATATDTVAVAKVQFEVGSTNIGTAATSSPYTTMWNSKGVSDGSYTLYAVAENTSGYYATSSVSVTVRNSPPVITSIAASSTATSSATITWTTDEPASSLVNYGTTSSYGNASSSVALATSHSITISGLTAGTPYDFEVQSVDAESNTATSSNQTFTTQSPPGPCDILAAAGTPCVAAHSVTRLMWSGYSGPLFQIERTSDSSTTNIGFITSTGIVNTSQISSFCMATTCNYSIIYDQMHSAASGNNLPQAIVADQAPVSLITLPSGLSLPHVLTVSGEFYRNRSSTIGIPTGNSSITEYYVRTNQTYSACCGDYGDMESSVADNGVGHMFALAYTSYNNSGSSNPPQFGIDRENGILSITAGTPYIFSLFAKHSQTSSTTAIELGNAQSGGLSTIYAGADPVAFDNEGGLSLGEGGDGSGSPTDFFEGVVVAGATASTTDALLQANIVGFYGQTPPASYQGPLDAAALNATECFSLRACKASYATGSNNAIQIRRASDNATENILILPSGYLDTATAESFCASTTCYVTEWYGQLGNYNAIQATNANQPQLIFNAGPTGTLPEVQFSGSQWLFTGALSTISQPISWSAVAERTGAFTSLSSIISGFTSGTQPNLQFFNGANQFDSYAGSTISATSTDNTWHALQALDNGTMSNLDDDGVLSYLTYRNVGTGALASTTVICIGANNSSGARQPLTGNIYEAILFPTDATLSWAALNANQHDIGGGW